jgi:hypothetical protein
MAWWNYVKMVEDYLRKVVSAYQWDNRQPIFLVAC